MSVPLTCILAVLLMLAAPFSLDGSWDLDSNLGGLQKLGSLTFQFKRQPIDSLTLSSQLYVYSCFLAQFNYQVEQDQLRFSFITASLLQQSCPVEPIDSLKALITKVNYFSITYNILTLLDLAQSITFTLKRQLIPYATILQGMWLMSAPTKRAASLAVIDKNTVLLCANNYGLSYELNLINETYPMLFMQVTKQNECVDQQFGDQLSQAVFFLVEENRTQISMRDYNGKYLVTLDRIGNSSGSNQAQNTLSTSSNRGQNNRSAIGQTSNSAGQSGNQGSAGNASNSQSTATIGLTGGIISTSRTDTSNNTGFIRSGTISTPSTTTNIINTPTTTNTHSIHTTTTNTISTISTPIPRTQPPTVGTISPTTNASPQDNQPTQSSNIQNNQNSLTQQPSTYLLPNQQLSSLSQSNINSIPINQPPSPTQSSLNSPFQSSPNSIPINQAASSPTQITFNSASTSQQTTIQSSTFANTQGLSSSNNQVASSTSTQSSNFNFFDFPSSNGAFGGSFSFDSLGSTNSFATQSPTALSSQGNQLPINQWQQPSTTGSIPQTQSSSSTTSQIVTLSSMRNSNTLITLNVPLSEFIMQSKWQIAWMKGLSFVPPMLDRSYIIFTPDRLILYCPCNTYYTQYRLRGNLLLGVKWQGTQNQCQNSQDILLTDLLFYSKMIKQNGQNLAFFFNQGLKLLEFKPFF